jgi:DNA topoisomerase IA
MKKIVCFAGALLFFFAAESFAACTVEDFQKELATMEEAMTKVGQDPEKQAAMVAMFQKDYHAEIMEFQQLMSSTGGDQEKLQAAFDKGCDLYSRINKKLAEMQ